MKRTLFYLSFTIVAAIVLSSCATGYSKSSYISSLEKFVGKVENNWKSYDEDDWTRSNKTMDAFKEKYSKYSEEFTEKDELKVAKLMAKYQWLCVKYTGKSWLDDLSKKLSDENEELINDINDIVNSF